MKITITGRCCQGDFLFLTAGKKDREMNTYIQITMFPDHDRRQAQEPFKAKHVKRLPVETALDLFPRNERQLVFADYFPGFEPRQH
jgi:hypothetical protein